MKRHKIKATLLFQTCNNHTIFDCHKEFNYYKKLNYQQLITYQMK